MKPTKLFLFLAVAVLLGACVNTITAQKMEYASSQMVELPQKGQFVLKGGFFMGYESPNTKKRRMSHYLLLACYING